MQETLQMSAKSLTLKLCSLVAGAMLALSACTTPAQAQPAMWTVKDADSTIYLFGTVHLLKPETEWKKGFTTQFVKDLKIMP